MSLSAKEIPTKFKSHGKASCTLDGQLILLDLEGPWNAELMLQIQHGVDRALLHKCPRRA
jgi:hypothetical protein